MKYLIVGLGNIGDEYTETRHNIGFKIVEAIAEKVGAKWEMTNFGMMAKFKYRGRIVHLLKPDTFMNLSGKAAAFWLKKLELPKDKLLIITDDLNLPLGKLRLKTKGGNGGHNGMKSLENELIGANYPRLRIGIGKEFSEGRQVDYVLGEWGENERSDLDEVIKGGVQAALKFTFLQIGMLMTEFNGKTYQAKKEDRS